MNNSEIADTFRSLRAEQDLKWMLDLGYQLTVYARGAYPLDRDPGSLNQLLGFNELQHQIYGRIRTLSRGDVWTIESFLAGLSEKAEHYGITRDLDAALKASRAFMLSAGWIQ
jgi:hypothetical protein